MLPCTLEGGAGSIDGNVDILLGALVDSSDDLFVMGVDGLEGLALNTLNKFIVNEPSRRYVSCDETFPARGERETYKPRGCSYEAPLGRVICCERDIMVIELLEIDVWREGERGNKNERGASDALK